MHTLVDCIAACVPAENNPYRIRHPINIRYFVLHRINVADKPEAIAKFFRNPGWHTDGQMPYHFIIDKAGVVSQCAPLSARCPGAKVFNAQGVQIAIVGDFRKHEPTPEQMPALYWLLGNLYAKLNISKTVTHDSDRDAMGDPDKICPGPYLKFDPTDYRLSQAQLAYQNNWGEPRPAIIV